jgi:hypothetical protein
MKSIILKTICAAAFLLASLNLFAASVQLKWTAPAAQAGVTIVRYNIYRVTTAGSEVTNVVVTGFTADGVTTAYTDPNLAPGTYFYKVTTLGKMSDGTLKESALSNEASALVPVQVIIVQPPSGLGSQVILP